MTTQYVRYHDDVEVRRSDEDQIFDEIIASMARQNETTADRYRHAVRATHAKSHGLLKGELRALDNLPEPLRQGLFAAACSYPVVVRAATALGEILADSVSTPRGMAIKVIGVEGEKLPGHEGEVTQDFLLDTGKRFTNSDAAAFLKFQLFLESITNNLEALKKAASGASCATNATLHAVGTDSAILDFFGHPPNHPLAESYFSQAPLRYGSYIAKLGVFPDTARLRALQDETLEVAFHYSALREAVVEFFRHNSAEYDIRIQLCTDLDKMPIEDASVEWPEDESLYQTVARLVLPVQEAYSPARRVYVDDVLSFSPAHALAAHRPLGSIMRARLKAYTPSSNFRHQMNTQPKVEPRTIESIPD